MLLNSSDGLMERTWREIGTPRITYEPARHRGHGPTCRAQCAQGIAGPQLKHDEPSKSHHKVHRLPVLVNTIHICSPTVVCTTSSTSALVAKPIERERDRPLKNFSIIERTPGLKWTQLLYDQPTLEKKARGLASGVMSDKTIWSYFKESSLQCL